MKVILDFLSQLRENNNREWFNAHKASYLDVKQRVESLAQAIIDELVEIDPQARFLTPADCTYRIYRDTRFSPDKTPYKRHIGIFVNPPAGKKSLTCGYYLHIEPDASLFAAGTICLPGPIMKAIRQSIYDEIDEYRSIVEDPEFRRLLPNLGDDFLKTAPQGFDRNWEFVDYVRPRNFLASCALTDAEMMRDDMLDAIVRPRLKQAKRFNDFINYTITEFSER